MVGKISTRRLCYEILRINRDELLSLAAGAESFYKPYQTKKVRQDGSIKVRDIEPPEKRSYLKSVQKRINQYILQPVINELPAGIMGGRKGYSTIDNARLHSRSQAIMKYDIKNYFPSITYSQVYKIFYHELNFCEESANLLAMLTTYQGHVPQGAPTSTSLAIFAMLKMCRDLDIFCNTAGIKWSVWVDDITLSASMNDLKTRKPEIDAIVKSMPFEISKEKETGVITIGSNKKATTTGITVMNNGRLSLGQYKKVIKKRVLRAKVFSEKLFGQLNYLKRVDPRFGNKLLSEYKAKFRK